MEDPNHIFYTARLTSSTVTTCGQTCICFLPLVITEGVSCHRGIHTHKQPAVKDAGYTVFGWQHFTVAGKRIQSLQERGRELM